VDPVPDPLLPHVNPYYLKLRVTSIHNYRLIGWKKAKKKKNQQLKYRWQQDISILAVSVYTGNDTSLTYPVQTSYVV
jgi:hypothetical protein